jgi:tetratricopeptide (TPR) repeat protein
VETAALVDLGEALRAAGQNSEAAEAYLAAVRITETSGDQYERARASTGLAHVSRAAGDRQEARRLWLAALTSYDALGLPEAAEVRDLLATLG